MSKERELIKAMKILLECTYMDSRQRQADVLIGRAIELLAQPEQDPVDWEKEKKSYLDEIDRLGVESNRDEEEIDRLTQLLVQPEQEPVAWFYDYDGTTWVKLKEPDLPNMHHSVKNIRPLFTTPPKPKPMSDGEITKNTANNIPIGEKLAFHAGIRWAEHQHGIGE